MPKFTFTSGNNKADIVVSDKGRGILAEEIKAIVEVANSNSNTDYIIEIENNYGNSLAISTNSLNDTISTLNSFLNNPNKTIIEELNKNGYSLKDFKKSGSIFLNKNIAPNNNNNNNNINFSCGNNIGENALMVNHYNAFTLVSKTNSTVDFSRIRKTKSVNWRKRLNENISQEKVIIFNKHSLIDKKIISFFYALSDLNRGCYSLDSIQFIKLSGTQKEDRAILKNEFNVNGKNTVTDLKKSIAQHKKKLIIISTPDIAEQHFEQHLNFIIKKGHFKVIVISNLNYDDPDFIEILNNKKQFNKYKKLLLNKEDQEKFFNNFNKNKAFSSLLKYFLLEILSPSECVVISMLLLTDLKNMPLDLAREIGNFLSFDREEHIVEAAINSKFLKLNHVDDILKPFKDNISSLITKNNILLFSFFNFIDFYVKKIKEDWVRLYPLNYYDRYLTHAEMIVHFFHDNILTMHKENKESTLKLDEHIKNIAELSLRICYIYYRKSDLPKMRDWIKNTQKIFNNATEVNSLPIWRLLCLEAKLEARSGHFQKSENLYKKSIRLIENNGLKDDKDRINYFIVKNCKASLLIKKGANHFKLADKILSKCEEEKKKILTENHPEHGITLHIQGNLLYERGNYSEALEKYDGALKVFKRFYKENNFLISNEEKIKHHHFYLTTLRQKANTNRLLGKLDEAKDLIDTVISLYNKSGISKSHYSFLTAKIELVKIYCDRNQFFEAEKELIDILKDKHTNKEENVGLIELLKISNQDPDAICCAGQVLLAQGFFNEARQAFVSAFKGHQNKNKKNNLKYEPNASQEVIKILDKLGCNYKFWSSTNCIKIIYQIGLSYFYEGRLKKAAVFYKEAIRLVKKISIGYDAKIHPKTLLPQFGIAYITYWEGNYGTAKDELLKITADQVKAYPQNPLDLANIHHLSGRILLRQSKFSEAKTELKKALGLYKQHNYKKHSNYFYMLYDLAHLAMYKGNYKKSEKLFLDAFTGISSIHSYAKKTFIKKLNMVVITHFDIIRILVGLGKLKYSRGLYQESIDFLDESEKICKDVNYEKHPIYANIKQYQGDALCALGKDAEAELVLHEAVKLFGKFNLQCATIYLSLAILATRSNRDFKYTESLFDDSERCIKKICENKEEHLSEHHRYAEWFMAKGSHYFKNKIYEKSIEHYEKSEKISDPYLHKKINPRWFDLYSNKALLYSEIGEFEKSYGLCKNILIGYHAYLITGELTQSYEIADFNRAVIFFGNQLNTENSFFYDKINIKIFFVFRELIRSSYYKSKDQAEFNEILKLINIEEKLIHKFYPNSDFEILVNHTFRACVYSKLEQYEAANSFYHEALKIAIKYSQNQNTSFFYYHTGLFYAEVYIIEKKSGKMLLPNLNLLSMSNKFLLKSLDLKIANRSVQENLNFIFSPDVWQIIAALVRLLALGTTFSEHPSLNYFVRFFEYIGKIEAQEKIIENRFYSDFSVELYKNNSEIPNKNDFLLLLKNFLDRSLNLLDVCLNIDCFKKRILQRFIIAYDAVSYCMARLGSLDCAIRVQKLIKKTEKKCDKYTGANIGSDINLSKTYANLFDYMADQAIKNQKEDKVLTLSECKKTMHYRDRSFSYSHRANPAFFKSQITDVSKQKWDDVKKIIIIFGKQDFDQIKDGKPFEELLSLGIELLYCVDDQVQSWRGTLCGAWRNIESRDFSKSMAFIFLTGEEKLIQNYRENVKTGAPIFIFDPRDQYPDAISGAQPIHKLPELAKEILGKFENQKLLSDATLTMTP